VAEELMTLEQIEQSCALLRLRRESIPALREYKPQSKGKAKKAEDPERSIDDVFGDLLNKPTTPE
jgi:hypothetical protein